MFKVGGFNFHFRTLQTYSSYYRISVKEIPGILNDPIENVSPYILLAIDIAAHANICSFYCGKL